VQSSIQRIGTRGTATRPQLSCPRVSQSSPALSIGLAVRNGSDVVGRCIESVLSQDFTDLELVICDNVSDDGTVALLEDYARTDPRVAFSVNDVNIGSHENMARTFRRSRGRLFRWISADDWLEPGCLSTCVQALERHPDAVGVTTGFTIHTDGGGARHEDYPGEFPSSPDAARRFERMLWFFHAGDAKYDPVYGMYRRDPLTCARPLRPSERTDWLLSAELALMGPILHIPERLANRRRDYPVRLDRAAFRRRLDPFRAEQLRTSPWRLRRELLALAITADLSDEQMHRCRRAVRRFWIKEAIRIARSSAADARDRAFRRS
jgi:glycosyltransferase involved in cell wall biosynthesis